MPKSFANGLGMGTQVSPFKHPYFPMAKQHSRPL
jgi:hypothetical protein